MAAWTQGMWARSSYPDLMHCKHLGTDAYSYGSILKFLTHFIMSGNGTPEKNLSEVWARLIAYSANPFSYMKLSMYDRGSDQFPLLRGKSAQIRHFGNVLLAVFRYYMDERELTHRLIRQLLQASIEFESILDDNDSAFKLPLSAANALLKQARRYALCVQGLRNEFGVRELLFHITPKFHYLLHIAEYSKQINPKLVWCYGAEDFVGKIKGLIGPNQVATRHWKVCSKVCFKYLVGLDCELRRVRLSLS